MKIYVTQGKNGTMINAFTNVKNQLIRAIVKKLTCGLLEHVIASLKKHAELVSSWILKIVHANSTL